MANPFIPVFNSKLKLIVLLLVLKYHNETIELGTVANLICIKVLSYFKTSKSYFETKQ